VPQEKLDRLIAAKQSGGLGMRLIKALMDEVALRVHPGQKNETPQLKADPVTTSLGATQLEALLESAQLLHATLDLDALLRHLLRSVMGRLLVSRALIAVRPTARCGSRWRGGCRR